VKTKMRIRLVFRDRIAEACSAFTLASAASVESFSSFKLSSCRLVTFYFSGRVILSYIGQGEMYCISMTSAFVD
jgi:hypothetical protein